MFVPEGLYKGFYTQPSCDCLTFCWWHWGIFPSFYGYTFFSDAGGIYLGRQGGDKFLLHRSWHISTAKNHFTTHRESISIVSLFRAIGVHIRILSRETLRSQLSTRHSCHSPFEFIAHRCTFIAKPLYLKNQCIYIQSWRLIFQGEEKGPSQVSGFRVLPLSQAPGWPPESYVWSLVLLPIKWGTCSFLLPCLCELKKILSTDTFLHMPLC